MYTFNVNDCRLLGIACRVIALVPINSSSTYDAVTHILFLLSERITPRIAVSLRRALILVDWSLPSVTLILKTTS
jgi:hypothetical protein